MRRGIVAAVILLGLSVPLGSAKARWQDAADRLARTLQSEIAWSTTATELRRAFVELDRERSSLAYSQTVLEHASRESMRRLEVYRRASTKRERASRARARKLYKLARGGVARLVLEDLGDDARSSEQRMRRGLSLRFVVRHDLGELSVHQRAERRATGELVAAAREMQALGGLAIVESVQDHVLVAAEVGVDPELRKIVRQRAAALEDLDPSALGQHRALIRQARESRRVLRSLRGLDGSSRLVRPVPGRVVGPFGEYEDRLLRLPMVRNGIELAARRNEPVRAVADGHVATVTRLPGFEDVVVVDHGGGQYTLTARLWGVTVREGDEVEAGDTLGRVAPKPIDDGLGPTVYLELRHGEKPIDPSGVLRRGRSPDE
jgi:murein hydrolase activator